MGDNPGVDNFLYGVSLAAERIRSLTERGSCATSGGQHLDDQVDQALCLTLVTNTTLTNLFDPGTKRPSRRSYRGAVNLAGAQRDRDVQGLGGLGVGGMGQAAAVSPVTSLQTANRRAISVR